MFYIDNVYYLKVLEKGVWTSISAVYLFDIQTHVWMWYMYLILIDID